MKIYLKKTTAIFALLFIISPLASASTRKKEGIKQELIQEKKKKPLNLLSENFGENIRAFKDETLEEIDQRIEKTAKKSKEVVDHTSEKAKETGKEVVDYVFSRFWKDFVPGSLLLITACVIGYAIVNKLDKRSPFEKRLLALLRNGSWFCVCQDGKKPTNVLKTV